MKTKGEKPKPKMVTSSKSGISYPMVSPNAAKYAKPAKTKGVINPVSGMKKKEQMGMISEAWGSRSTGEVVPKPTGVLSASDKAALRRVAERKVADSSMKAKKSIANAIVASKGRKK